MTMTDRRLIIELERRGFRIHDSLPVKQRVMRVITPRPSDRLVKMTEMLVVKMLVPHDSWLGRALQAERKERDPRTSKARRARERPLTTPRTRR